MPENFIAVPSQGHCGIRYATVMVPQITGISNVCSTTFQAKKMETFMWMHQWLVDSPKKNASDAESVSMPWLSHERLVNYREHCTSHDVANGTINQSHQISMDN